MQAPFDGRFKILAEEYPGLLLRLLGILKPGTKPEVVSILRELQLDAVEVDHVYRIGQERLVHFEAITRWSAQRTSRLALYRFLQWSSWYVNLQPYIGANDHDANTLSTWEAGQNADVPEDYMHCCFRGSVDPGSRTLRRTSSEIID